MCIKRIFDKSVITNAKSILASSNTIKENIKTSFKGRVFMVLFLIKGQRWIHIIFHTKIQTRHKAFSVDFALYKGTLQAKTK